MRSPVFRNEFQGRATHVGKDIPHMCQMRSRSEFLYPSFAICGPQSCIRLAPALNSLRRRETSCRKHRKLEDRYSKAYNRPCFDSTVCMRLETSSATLFRGIGRFLLGPLDGVSFRRVVCQDLAVSFVWTFGIRSRQGPCSFWPIPAWQVAEMCRGGQGLLARKTKAGLAYARPAF